MWHLCHFLPFSCTCPFSSELFSPLASFQIRLQKTQIEKEVEEHKQKLLRSEQSLQASQNKEQDLCKKMEVRWQSTKYHETWYVCIHLSISLSSFFLPLFFHHIEWMYLPVSHWMKSSMQLYVVGGSDESPCASSFLCCHSSSLLVCSSCQELQKEKNTVTVQLDQSSRRLAQLEEEKKSTDQSLKRTQGMVDDLKGKLAEWQRVFKELSPSWSSLHGVFIAYCLSFCSAAKSEGQTEELKKLQAKLEQQTQASAQELLNIKKTLSDAENNNNR